MARGKKRTARSKSSARQPNRRRSATASGSPDAITLLKGDHREAEKLFASFEAARSPDKKQKLAAQVCKLLTVHTEIEEEIFYPAFLEATKDKDIHHEAEVEHGGAKNLIAEIEASGPEDDYYDAKVHVLSEMIKHHVNEEEKRDGMFSKAKKSRMDLTGLGQQLSDRKRELARQ